MAENEIQKDSPSLSIWVQEQIQKLKLEAAYRGKGEFLQASLVELEEIARNRNLTVESLLRLAASSAVQHDDLDQALILSSRIYALKK